MIKELIHAYALNHPEGFTDDAIVATFPQDQWATVYNTLYAMAFKTREIFFDDKTDLFFQRRK